MALELKPGKRCRSVVCTTEVIVVRGAGESVDLRCGGHAMVPAGEASPGDAEQVAGLDQGTLLGKRYTDEEGTIELLCMKAGSGSLSIGDIALHVSGAKPLPASD